MTDVTATADILAAQTDLLFAAVEIGSITDMEYWALDGMAKRVHKTGKPVRDLTVGELVDMLKCQNDYHAAVEALCNQGDTSGKNNPGIQMANGLTLCERCKSVFNGIPKYALVCPNCDSTHLTLLSNADIFDTVMHRRDGL